MILKNFIKKGIFLVKPFQQLTTKLNFIDFHAQKSHFIYRQNKGLLKKVKFNKSAISVKDMKINYDPSKKTQIVSLNQQQLEQLSQIPSYMTSISYLQKNQLQKSLEYLNYSLHDAKTNLPESINLHMCILNRKSILLKLLSQNQQFISILEEIFFLSHSLKGIRSLDTQKHLNNYLLSLLFNDKQKMALVIQFVQSFQEIIKSSKLEKSISNFVFYDSLADLLVRNQIEKGFQKLQSLPQQNFQQKYFKTNNIAWMKYISWAKKVNSTSQFAKKIKNDGQELIKLFIRALFDMEYCVPQNIPSSNQSQTSKNSYFMDLLKGYIVNNVKQLRFIPDKVTLFNPQSHILTMNLANLLFESQRYEQCVYFMKLSLSRALDQNEVERVGLCLLLLSKINFQSGQNYQQILIGILENANSYPLQIIKEGLSLLSQYLFKQGRYIEAQSYGNQMNKLSGDLDLQGLLIPDYDFSF